MKSLYQFVIGASIVASSVLNVSAATFTDDFSNPSQLNYYSVDRSPAGSFSTTNFDGDDRLKLSVAATYDSPYDSSFYNFQGYQRWADTSHTQTYGLGAGGTISVDVYVPSAWNGTTTKIGADLWGRLDDPTQSPGNDPYPTIGIYNYGDGGGAHLSMYAPYGVNDDPNNVFYDIYDPIVNFDAWNNLKMTFTGSGINYYLNNNLVLTDSSVEYAQPGVTLEAALLQGWRPSGLTSGYDIYFDNLGASVPEPASLGILGAGLCMLQMRRRRNRCH